MDSVDAVMERFGRRQAERASPRPKAPSEEPPPAPRAKPSLSDEVLASPKTLAALKGSAIFAGQLAAEVPPEASTERAALVMLSKFALEFCAEVEARLKPAASHVR